jgi:hypothetical protein
MNKLLKPYGKIMVVLIIVGLIAFGVQLYNTIDGYLNPEVVVQDQKDITDVTDFTSVDQSINIF